jgi:cephalosporin-C deacetylase-like acetyl esterase
MSSFFSLFTSFDNFWKPIIRPEKDKYTFLDLGPSLFKIQKKTYKRTDFFLKNSRQLKIQCSFWEPIDEERESIKLPCIIYLHGNSSSRCEVINYLKYFLYNNITILAFDFSGCGQSEGDYISLGYYEQNDVDCVINYLNKTKRVSRIGLWGRSMGAVTAIMYSYNYPNKIVGIVVDSPFYSLTRLIEELIKEKIKIMNNFIYNIAIKMISDKIYEKYNFRIEILNTYIFAEKCNSPCFFCHAINDNFVNKKHSKDLYKIYSGEKNIMYVEGNHNSLRPKYLIKNIINFFFKLFEKKKKFVHSYSFIENCRIMEKYLKKDESNLEENISEIKHEKIRKFNIKTKKDIEKEQNKKIKNLQHKKNLNKSSNMDIYFFENDFYD